MKKLMYLLSVLLFIWSISFATTSMKHFDSINLLGYGPTLDKSELSQNDNIDDEVDRKRRHRRRRQVRPPKKGW
tara:strand:- start:2537 stop:2758 length:222 start_codon:yes stop_codon:yes gene_type:complete